jgi:hypothetical protein
MFTNIDEIITYKLDSNEYGYLNMEFISRITANSDCFRMIDFDICDKGYSIAYKKNLFISFN